MAACSTSIQIRRAVPRDLLAINELIKRSLSELGEVDYEPHVLAAAVESAKIDAHTIGDETCFVAVDGDEVIGCGAWSGHALSRSVRLQTIYVDPRYARRGIGRRLLNMCECDAILHADAEEFELLATHIGTHLYTRSGYLVEETVEMPVSGGLRFQLTRMTKSVSA